jgi:hypothetical protein
MTISRPISGHGGWMGISSRGFLRSGKGSRVGHKLYSSLFPSVPCPVSPQGPRHQEGAELLFGSLRSLINNSKR